MTSSAETAASPARAAANTRKQVRNGMLSPAQFERQQILKAEGI